MIHLNYKYADSTVIGSKHGIDIKKIFLDNKDKISKIINKLNNEKNVAGAGLQWMNLGYSEETFWYVKEYAALVENRFENILVLGMGGSSSGAMAITEALLPSYRNFLPDEKRNNFPRIFYLDNIDPDEITGLLEILDLKKTLVNVITKSGSTAETMSLFMIIKSKMQQELGDDYRKNIVATTDKNTGVLRQIAEQEGYKTFIVPDDVGSMFSAFSAVGLLPLALSGIDMDEIIRGVKDMDAALQNTNIEENIAAQNALIHYIADTQKGKHISVMMPYSAKLKSFAKWYVQLWSESLGKEFNLDGNIVHTGQTPLQATGVTDQHTQIQLFNEGPNNKIITFVRLENFKNTIEIPNIFEYTGIGYLGGKTVNNLLNAEADATRVVLTDYNRPTLTITLPEINGYYIGQLMYMFEVQTAIAGALYGIDTFSQPGVEQAKNYTYALMGRTGYEDSANTILQKMNNFDQVLVSKS